MVGDRARADRTSERSRDVLQHPSLPNRMVVSQCGSGPSRGWAMAGRCPWGNCLDSDEQPVEPGSWPCGERIDRGRPRGTAQPLVGLSIFIREKVDIIFGGLHTRAAHHLGQRVGQRGLRDVSLRIPPWGGPSVHNGSGRLSRPFTGTQRGFRTNDRDRSISATFGLYEGLVERFARDRSELPAADHGACESHVRDAEDVDPRMHTALAPYGINSVAIAAYVPPFP